MIDSIKQLKQFSKDLKDLLDTAYDRGQAHYNYDFYGETTDDLMDWQECYETAYHKAIAEFIMSYGPKI